MILIIDSFFTGSHKYWGIELKKRLPFNVELLTLSGKHWKWRMEGGAFELAEKFKKLKKKPKIIIATDMVNIPLFYAFASITKDQIPCIMYFHENQFAYPISIQENKTKVNRDNHYSFINLTSALFATELVFNSEFNRASFFEGAAKLINKLPKNTLSINNLISNIIYPGIEQPNNQFNKSEVPIILWNHRWEHDKNPNLFIQGLELLKSKSILFELIILGKGTEQNEVRNLFNYKFKKELLHCGFTESRELYKDLVSKATHLPITSKHDFFGISVAEAMSYGCFAILPDHQAYPEHLFQNEQSGIIYDFPTGFNGALEDSLINYNKGKVNQNFIFDQVIKKWDELLTQKFKLSQKHGPDHSILPL